MIDYVTFYFDWLGGIGGWIILACIGTLAIAWVLFDSQERHLQATGWRIAALSAMALFLPTLVIDLGFVNAYQAWPAIFAFLGTVATAISVLVLFMYLVSFQGMRGCYNGHGLYRVSEGRICPLCNQLVVSVDEPAQLAGPRNLHTSMLTAPPRGSNSPSRPTRRNLKQARAPSIAWLVDVNTQRSHALVLGQTRIGRTPHTNDIVLRNGSVSREHALVLHKANRFVIYDRASQNGLHINGRFTKTPCVLAHNDEIQLGDVRLRFVLAS